MTLLFVGDGGKQVYKWCQNRATILHFTYITQLYFSLTFQLLSQHLWRKGNVWMICGGTECALNRHAAFQLLGSWQDKTLHVQLCRAVRFNYYLLGMG